MSTPCSGHVEFVLWFWCFSWKFNCAVLCELDRNRIDGGGRQGNGSTTNNEHSNATAVDRSTFSRARKKNLFLWAFPCVKYSLIPPCSCLVTWVKIPRNSRILLTCVSQKNKAMNSLVLFCGCFLQGQICRVHELFHNPDSSPFLLVHYQSDESVCQKSLAQTSAAKDDNFFVINCSSFADNPATLRRWSISFFNASGLIPPVDTPSKTESTFCLSWCSLLLFSFWK